MSAILSGYTSADKYRKLLALCVFLIFCNGFHVADAQVDTRWISSDGNWNDVANWDNGVPVGEFNAIIDSTAGEIIQDAGPIELTSLELNSSTAKLVLDNSLVVGHLDWRTGEIGGSEEFVSAGIGQIIGEVTLETTFNNTGYMQLGAKGHVTRVATDTVAVWNNCSGSVLDMSHSGFGGFVRNGQGQLNVETESLVLMNGPHTEFTWAVVNEGTIEISGSAAVFFEDYEQSKSGHLVLNNGTANFTTGSAIKGKVSGDGGMIMGGVGFDAVLEPGGSEIGSIQFAGSLPMTPTAVSNFQIGPGLSSDTVTHIGGGLQLNGTLNIEALPGVTTGIYTLFTFHNLETEDIQLGTVPAGFKGSLFLDAPNKAIKLDVQAIRPVLSVGDTGVLLDADSIYPNHGSGG